MDKLRVGLISLGCDKNRLDSEVMLSNLNQEYSLVHDPKLADVIIINTCGFIESAKQESIDTILEMSQYKEKFNCKLIVVTGCLAQRYGKELMELLPEIDIMLGVNDYDKLNETIRKCIETDNSRIYNCDYSDSNINEGKRILTTSTYTAYLRIAEGCDNHCTYCIIPKIRGKYRSRTIENIINECNDLANQGVKEIILIAQDTTRYGIDIYGKKMLPELIQKISKINEIEWIRLLYCYPEELTDEIINEISMNDKVCKYIDIPIQHISDSILKLMGRRGRKLDIIENIDKLRARAKGIAIRTTIIVGFPGETEENFEELKDFVSTMKFDNLGVFKYSREEGTAAAEMKNQVPEEIKSAREGELMVLQKQVMTSINKSKIGSTYKVIVEGKKGELWYGRSYEMAPDIDGVIYIKCKKTLKIGTMVNVKITHSLEYDLVGVV
ncbi:MULTISPECIES: 30S ribosomal protein S12 methylthiotransferase RimO [Clostridium]|uniref:Ribosomal protein uS12 methylthiotransferase RimO n=3 Tax=Clostridium TaxID=1485 RepID=A0A162JFK9_9CLOT|nr:MULTISPECIES: 30S ribosomal protein S12 methylthiotransferase RimO [Clostridium]AGY77612.1 30S ribosomal protein S12 methylthiotransferase RimO [Clostridium autoethanogenum DSM 10061]ALU37752.1 Ribosomal protein S12 methylthiotransferase rimO [Clostridium autoethanogenum DSM 10061]OAA94415.1 Ribosomal protein S12 methylthiotransferase RimO [Clostridium coskatii]OBR93159.1 ribosomal protein S12 methylthiotransferase RimO [Clostridium coskatii]OVY49897.1 Ribosomal protein S12 methylthiotransf